MVKTKGILGGNLNIRSLVPKPDEIRILLSESNIDFLCISETWLHDKIPTSTIDDILVLEGTELWEGAGVY